MFEKTIAKIVAPVIRRNNAKIEAEITAKFDAAIANLDK